jgi:hypothetical protein
MGRKLQLTGGLTAYCAVTIYLHHPRLRLEAYYAEGEVCISTNLSVDTTVCAAKNQVSTILQVTDLKRYRCTAAITVSVTHNFSVLVCHGESMNEAQGFSTTY